MTGLLACVLLSGLPTDESGAGDGGGSKLEEPFGPSCGTDKDFSASCADVVLDRVVGRSLSEPPVALLPSVSRAESAVCSETSSSPKVSCLTTCMWLGVCKGVTSAKVRAVTSPERRDASKSCF